MKFKTFPILIALASAASLAFCPPAAAQTNTLAEINASGGTNITVLAGTPEGNFFTQGYQWVTSANTGDPNQTWTNSYLELSDGYSQETGSGAMDIIEAQYDSQLGLTAGAYGQFAGVGSAFNGGGVIVGYEVLRYYSLKGEVDLMAGYDSLVKGGWTACPRLTLVKWTTDYLAAKVGLGVPIKFQGKPDFMPKLFVEFTIPFRL